MKLLLLSTIWCAALCAEHEVTPKETGYPVLACQSNAHGAVILKLTVDSNGQVEKAEATYAAYPVLGKAAVESIKQWSFAPSANAWETDWTFIYLLAEKAKKNEVDKKSRAVIITGQKCEINPETQQP